MLFTTALSLFLGLGPSLVAASSVSSRFNTTARSRECGTTPSKGFITQAEAHFAENKIIVDAEARASPISIPVHCGLDSCFALSKLTPDFCTGHVVYKDGFISGGNITDSQIQSSINVLNHDYASCGISFHLVCTDRTHNRDWFNNAGMNE